MNKNYIIAAVLALFWITGASAAPICDKFKPESHGKQIDLSSLNLSGQYDMIILHFWATYCPKCPGEMTLLNEFTAQLNNKKVLVVSLAIDTDTEAERDLARAAGVKGVPTTVFVDGKHNIIGRAVGPVEWNIKEFNEWYKERS